MCCQATKNALYLAGYALFGCEIFLNTPPGFLFSPIRGHKKETAIMPRKGENIRKRKDGRWEARYEKSRDQNGRIQYGYVYAH